MHHQQIKQQQQQQQQQMTTILVRLIYGVQNHSKRSHCHKVGSEVFELFENRK